jgi:hypothetical protein
VRVHGGWPLRSGIRGMPAEQLEGRAAERVLIGPAIHRLSEDLLGGGVIHGADELTVSSKSGRAHRRLAHAEIGQVNMVRTARPHIEQHVRWLNVPVHQTAGVRGVECRRDCRQDPFRAGGCQRTAPGHQAPQVTAGNEPHGNEQDAIGLAGLVDGDDVRIFDRSCRAGLREETLPEDLVPGHRRVHDLQRHLTFQPLVVRAEHCRHAAPADLLLQPIPRDPVTGGEPRRVWPWRECWPPFLHWVLCRLEYASPECRHYQLCPGRTQGVVKSEVWPISQTNELGVSLTRPQPSASPICWALKSGSSAPYLLFSTIVPECPVVRSVTVMFQPCVGETTDASLQ